MGNKHAPAKIDMEKQFPQLDAAHQHYIKKLNAMNSYRADHVRTIRRKSRFTGLSLFAFAIGIYVYTLYAVKQEKLLEDFDRLPPDMEPLKSGKQSS